MVNSLIAKKFRREFTRYFDPKFNPPISGALNTLTVSTAEGEDPLHKNMGVISMTQNRMERLHFRSCETECIVPYHCHCRCILAVAIVDWAVEYTDCTSVER